MNEKARTFSSQGVRIFFAPNGVMYDDGEISGTGWYIQQMAVFKSDERGIEMPGISDGIGPYDTFEEAVWQIANEFGTWQKPREDDDQLSLDLEPIRTPDQ